MEPEVVLGDRSTPLELAAVLDVMPGSIIHAGIEHIDRLLTVAESLNFEEARVIAESFGFRVRRKIQ